MNAYQKGIQAARQGIRRVDNPYHFQSPSWHEWNIGWKSVY